MPRSDPGGLTPPPGGDGFAASTQQDAYIAIGTGILAFLCIGPIGIAAIFYGNKVRNDPLNPKQQLGTVGFFLGIAGLLIWAVTLLVRAVS